MAMVACPYCQEVFIGSDKIVLEQVECHLAVCMRSPHVNHVMPEVPTKDLTLGEPPHDEPSASP